MRKNACHRTGAMVLVSALLLAGCGAPATAATAEATPAPSAAPSATPTAAPTALPAATEAPKENTQQGTKAVVLGAPTANPDDPYAYLSNYFAGDDFDDSGYFKGIKASDYVTLPENFTQMTLTGDYTVTEEEIMAAIDEQYLAYNPAVTKVTDRVIADGDMVNITSCMVMLSGEDVIYGDPSNSDVEADSTLPDEYSYALNRALVGHRAGEHFEVMIETPVDTAGNTAQVAQPVTVNYISQYSSPELTDEWVRQSLSDTYGVNTVEELKAYVKEQLRFNKASQDVYRQLVSGSTFADTVPANFTKHYQDYMLYYAYLLAMNKGMDLIPYLAANGFDSPEAYLEAASQKTLNDMRNALLFQAVAEQLGIRCGDATYEESYAKYFGNNVQEQTILFGKNYVKSNLLGMLVMQQLMDNATAA